ncbi:MAG: hypothetical protein HQ559_17885 [Lentisphaerae bacterium]|nr:hypothetical protein [Lentisphaerota bacterium]
MKQLLYWFTRNERVLDIDTFDAVRVATRFPLWVMFIVAVLLVAASVYMYRGAGHPGRPRRRVLTALRSLVYIVLLCLCAGPRLEIEAKGRQDGPMPIIVDRTESMSIKDVDNTPRLDLALRLEDALERNREKGRGLEPVHYLYGDTLAPWDRKTVPGSENPTGSEKQDETSRSVAIQGSRTSLGTMMVDGLKRHRGVYSPGMVILTDGAHNTADLIEPAIAHVAERRVPIYFIPVGGARPRDVSLDHIIGEDIVFVDEQFRFFVSMTHFGYTGRRLAPKATFGSVPVTVAPVTVEDERETTFPVVHTPTETGVYDLSVSIPADSDELVAQNNTVTRKVRVIKDRIRVLMVFGTPTWEFRFLRGALERDRRVDYRIYLQSADPRLFRHSQKRFIKDLPGTERDLFRSYDMVILSAIDMHSLPGDFHGMLEKFVASDGGGLVVLSDGSEIPYSMKNTPLDTLLPVRVLHPVGLSSFKQEMFDPLRAPYRLRVVGEGHGSPMTAFDNDRRRNREIWDSFPALYEVCPEAELKPSAIALLEAVSRGEETPRPALVYHAYGNGSVLYMGFDSTWRWRREYGDRYFRGFWGKVVQSVGLPHLLGKSTRSHIYLDRLEAGVGDRVTVTASIRNNDYSPYIAEQVPVSALRADGTTLDLELPEVSGRSGIFRASYYPETEGKVVFTLPDRFGAEAMELQVRRISREYSDSGVDLELMQRIAHAANGDVFSPSMPVQTNRLASETAALAKPGRDTEGNKATIFDDETALDKFATHVLATISDRRPAVPIEEQESLWDTVGLMFLALALLGTEYILRKRWYLD